MGRSEFEKHALEVIEVPQRLDHRTGLFHDLGEIEFADGIVGESKLEAMSPTQSVFDTLIIIQICYPIERKPSTGRDPNSPAIRPGARGSIA